jgi:tubulin polyglutamylase TTLL11
MNREKQGKIRRA